MEIHGEYEQAISTENGKPSKNGIKEYEIIEKHDEQNHKYETMVIKKDEDRIQCCEKELKISRYKTFS